MLFLDKPFAWSEVFLAQNEGVDSVISFGGCGCPVNVRNGNPVWTLLGSELHRIAKKTQLNVWWLFCWSLVGWRLNFLGLECFRAISTSTSLLWDHKTSLCQGTLPRHEEKFTAGEIQWAQVSDVCHERFHLALGCLGFQYGSMSMCWHALHRNTAMKSLMAQICCLIWMQT